MLMSQSTMNKKQTGFMAADLKKKNGRGPDPRVPTLLERPTNCDFLI